MRTRYTLINMAVNVGGQMLNLVLQFVSRMVFIHYLSAAYLGVNGLFTDVLGILNLAELGIGTSMIFSLYEPAAQNDEQKLARLMNLYKWLYRAVAAGVLLLGLALLPALPYLIKGGEEIENIRLIYLMYVASSASSYLLSYKNSIYLAYQKAYVRNLWVQVCECLRFILQIVVLILTGNFILYLLAQFVLQFVPNIIVSVKADRDFPYLKHCHELPEKEECKGILKNIGAMSMHKLGTVAVRNTDSLIMSSFIGLSAVGLYSNYKMLLSGVNSMMSKVTNAFVGSIGNLSAMEDEKRVYSVYRELEFLFFVLYAYWAAGLFTLFNSFINLCFGTEYCFSMVTVGIIVAEFYITGMRQVNLLFREAMGLFWYDRYKPLAEAVINLVVSLILVQKFGIAGTIGGTIISSLCTCVWVEPYILLRYGVREQWEERLKLYFASYVRRTALVAAVAAASYAWVQFCPARNILWFLLDGIVYTLLFAAVMLLVYQKRPEFVALKNRALGIVKRKRA